MVVGRGLPIGMGGFLAACAAASGVYPPCPVPVEGGLSSDAFAVCRDVLLRRYGSLVVADAAAFLLQTDWVAMEDPPGERRASVFRGQVADELAVVVEVRCLTEPVLGMPRWTQPRGWDAAERELRDWLQDAFRR